MEARLMTLEDVGRASVPTRRAIAPRRRGADTGNFDQWRLREYVRALVKAYGYREDFRGKSTPWRVPYVPLPFAGEMLHYFRGRAYYWLASSVPEEAKQPNFIKKWIARASEVVGKVDKGTVVTPNPDSYEDAPAAVASKAPDMFRPEYAAGQPNGKVLKAEASWRFFDALIRLAIHFDALAGQPTKLEIFVDAVKEQAAEVGGKLLDAAEHVTDLGELAGAGKTALKWIAIAAAGLGALYVVTR